ncbi:MAG: hypothetical protein LBI63_03660 [Candidatus Ancillula sp.]|jgi:hypothetical protein|nr:hypothetical protein [Candidatus Ancillula sp.]
MSKKNGLIKYGQKDSFWSRFIENANRKMNPKSKFVVFIEGRELKGLYLDDLPADEQEFLGYIPSERAEAEAQEMLQMQHDQEDQARFDADDAEDAQVVEDVDITRSIPILPKQVIQQEQPEELRISADDAVIMPVNKFLSVPELEESLPRYESTSIPLQTKSVFKSIPKSSGLNRWTDLVPAPTKDEVEKSKENSNSYFGTSVAVRPASSGVKRPSFGGWATFAPGVRVAAPTISAQVKLPQAHMQVADIAHTQAAEFARSAEFAQAVKTTQIQQVDELSSGACKYSARLMVSDISRMSIANADSVTVPWGALCPSVQEKLKLAGIHPNN